MPCLTQACKQRYTALFIQMLDRIVQYGEGPDEYSDDIFDADSLLLLDVSQYIDSLFEVDIDAPDFHEYEVHMLVHTQEQFDFCNTALTTEFTLGAGPFDVSQHVGLALNLAIESPTAHPVVTGIYQAVQHIGSQYIASSRPLISALRVRNSLTVQDLVSLARQGVGNKIVYVDRTHLQTEEIRQGFSAAGFVSVFAHSGIYKLNRFETTVTVRTGETTFSIEWKGTLSVQQQEGVRSAFIAEQARRRSAALQQQEQQQQQQQQRFAPQLDATVSWYDEVVQDPILLEDVTIRAALQDNDDLVLFIVDGSVPCLVSVANSQSLELPQNAPLVENFRCKQGTPLYAMNRYGITGDMRGINATGLRGYINRLGDVLQPGTRVYTATKTGMCDFADEDGVVQHAGQPVYTAAAASTEDGPKMLVTLGDTLYRAV